MSTAIGDLVVSIGAETDGLNRGLASSQSAVSSFSEEVGGSSRGLRFLGNQAAEFGEKLSAVNPQLGGSVSALGGIVEGAGTAARGMRSMQSAIQATTAAQVLLNSVSPLGWAAMAAGAVAAGAAYLILSHNCKTAAEEAEEQKKASENTETALKRLTTEAEKLAHTELENFRLELQKTGKTATEQLAALKQFAELSAKISKEKEIDKSQKDTDSASAALAKKQAELKTSGMTAGEKFAANFAAEHPVTQLPAGAITPEQGRTSFEQHRNLELAEQIGKEIDRRKEEQDAQKDLIAAQNEMKKEASAVAEEFAKARVKTEELTRGQRFVANEEEQHHLTPDQRREAQGIGRQMDQGDAAKELVKGRMKDQADAQRELAAAIEKPLSPAQRLIEEADRLKAAFEQGYLSQDQFKSGVEALAEKAQEMKPKQKADKFEADHTSAAAKGTAEGWKAITDAIAAGHGDDREKHAERTAAASEAILELLQDAPQGGQVAGGADVDFDFGSA